LCKRSSIQDSGTPLTIGKHNKKDNKGKGPFKEIAKHAESHENINESGDDIE